MIFFPQQQLTKRLLSSKGIYLALSLFYVACLLTWLATGLSQSVSQAASSIWSSQHKAAAFGWLFQNAEATALVWLHLLLLDLLQA
ncbi:hypothetical protein WJX84_008909, partial [Apatococcus fuscideae]